MAGQFHLYMMGGEQPAMRTTLLDEGVRNIGVSFSGLERRMPKKGVKVANWGFERVFLDSGGHSANKEPGKRTVGEWEEYASRYRALIEENVNDLTLVTEFDCDVLGPEWIARQRVEFYNHLDPEMFLPIWHPQQGLSVLDELSGRYPRIGIHESVFAGGMNINGRLNGLARRGVWLHGVGVSRSEVLRLVDFSSAASTTWLSATRFGETMVWDGSRLQRYPAKMKAQARRRWRSLFEREGFDPDLIMADNAREVTRLSIWSWRQVEEDTQRYRRNSPAESSQPQEGGTDAFESGTSDDSVATMGSETRNDVATSHASRTPTIHRDKTALPVLAMSSVDAYDKDSKETRSLPIAGITSAPQRVCNTCFAADRCPAFKPDNACAYDIPIEVHSPEQRKALVNGALGMQAQRVAFLRFVEELSGGYADPNLSQEIDRLMKMFSTIADLEDNRDVFRMQIEARGKSGALTRLFGGDAAAALLDRDPGLDQNGTDRVIEGMLDGRKVTEQR